MKMTQWVSFVTCSSTEYDGTSLCYLRLEGSLISYTLVITVVAMMKLELVSMILRRFQDRHSIY